MRILVASENPAKLRGTARAVATALPGKHQLEGRAYPHPLPEMPEGEEVFQGARRRARWAQGAGADLGIGIESGLLRFPGVPGEFMVTVACVVGRGKEGWGTSASFPFRFPGTVPDPVGGYVGRLTGGKLHRADLVYHAVLLALFSWRGSEG